MRGTDKRNETNSSENCLNHLNSRTGSGSVVDIAVTPPKSCCVLSCIWYQTWTFIFKI